MRTLDTSLEQVTAQQPGQDTREDGTHGDTKRAEPLFPAPARLLVRFSERFPGACWLGGRHRCGGWLLLERLTAG